MSVVVRLLFYVALVGSATSSIYCLMVLVAAVRFGLRKRRDDLAQPDFLPPISVFKPLHGTEPGLERNLETFFEQQYPAPFELLFCARHESDLGLQLARRVGERYPHVDAQYVTCGEPIPQFHNAKVYSFEKLDSVARNEILITSDADVRVAPDYLLRMVQNLRDPKMGIASCVYLGTAYGGGVATFATRLDAVGKSVEMTSGVLFADMLEGTKFALGATMATRKRSFREVGGFGELGQFYADDFELGNRLAKTGQGREEDGDARHPADGAGSAVLALVPQSDAMDAVDATFASARASRHGAHVCDAVWVAGIAVGSGLRGTRWLAFCGFWRWWPIAGCRRRRF